MTPTVTGTPHVAMRKDGTIEDLAIDDQVNLWLCADPNPGGPGPGSNPNCEHYDQAAGQVKHNGAGHLVVLERIYNQFDAQGAGAFEFQIKFDHKVFDIEVFHGLDINADGDCADPGEEPGGECYLYSTGRLPGTMGIGGCSATIITENWYLFGCVSKDDPDNPGIQLGPMGDGIVATLHIEPEIDMVSRLTPGQKNGVVRTILDENCEAADIFGDPLGTGTFDQLGREILLPGIVTGGLIERCDDITITTRILEGDLDLSCAVTVADDQLEAFRYGAVFGSIYYDPWFDLEPWEKDFDIDIKDLQKVFGRNGSTCDNPVPPQPAEPPPPEGPDPGGELP
jgi:hypothetical protein